RWLSRTAWLGAEIGGGSSGALRAPRADPRRVARVARECEQCGPARADARARARACAAVSRARYASNRYRFVSVGRPAAVGRTDARLRAARVTPRLTFCHEDTKHTNLL